MSKELIGKKVQDLKLEVHVNERGNLGSLLADLAETLKEGGILQSKGNVAYFDGEDGTIKLFPKLTLVVH